MKEEEEEGEMVESITRAGGMQGIKKDRLQGVRHFRHVRSVPKRFVKNQGKI